jgi:hypothetical protein
MDDRTPSNSYFIIQRPSLELGYIRALSERRETQFRLTLVWLPIGDEVAGLPQEWFLNTPVLWLGALVLIGLVRGPLRNAPALLKKPLIIPAHPLGTGEHRRIWRYKISEVDSTLGSGAHRPSKSSE